jgi:endonuclease YncB( thermonuclease family)
MKLRSSLTIVAAVAGCALIMCNAVAQESCKLTAVGTAKAAAARDGRTFVLEDGREVRLAAIEAGNDSRDALQSLIGGQVLRLERQGADLDRYGRLVAFAYAGDVQQSVQHALLAQGRARVSARSGSKACADALLTIEHAARAAGCGPIPISPLCRLKILTN